MSEPVIAAVVPVGSPAVISKVVAVIAGPRGPKGDPGDGELNPEDLELVVNGVLGELSSPIDPVLLFENALI